jgi:hypothetical protein
MIIDGLMLFSGTSNGATGGITLGANTDAPTTGTQIASNILDLGVTSGVPSSANGGGARDLGIGDDPALKLSAIATVAWVGGTSVQLEISGAPDNGSGAPGAYTVMWTSPAIAIASIVAGVQLANVDIPRVIPGQALPRFLRLRYISVGTFTTSSIEAQIVLDLDQQIQGAAGVYSGYPAGITVAN